MLSCLTPCVNSSRHKDARAVVGMVDIDKEQSALSAQPPQA